MEIGTRVTVEKIYKHRTFWEWLKKKPRELQDFIVISNGTDKKTMNYEVLPEMISDDQEETLMASWTANNGRRILIVDKEVSDEAAHFHLNKEQALILGEALMRWGNDDH